MLPKRLTFRTLLIVTAFSGIVLAVLHVPRMVGFYHWEVGGQRQHTRYWLELSLWLNERAGWLTHTTLTWDLVNLSIYYGEVGENVRARTLLDRALAHVTRVHGHRHEDIAWIRNTLGNWHYHRGEYRLAEQNYKKSLEVWEHHYSSHEDGGLMEALENAWFWLGDNYLSSVGPTLQRLYLLGDTAMPLGGRRSWIETLMNLAVVYKETGRDQEAETLHRRIIDQSKHILPRGHPARAVYVNVYAAHLHSSAKIAEALKQYEEALSILRNTYTVNHPLVLDQRFNVALAKYHLGGADEPEREFVELLRLRSGQLSGNHPKIAMLQQVLGGLYLRHRKYGKALTVSQAALQAARLGMGENHPTTINLWAQNAEIYYKTRKFRSAYDAAKRAYRSILNRQTTRTGLEQERGQDPWYTRNALEILIRAAFKYEEEEALYDSDLIETAFLAAQVFVNDSVGPVLNQLALRTSTADAGLNSLVRQGQDEARIWRTLDASLSDALQLPDSPESKRAVSNLRSQLHNSRKRIDEIRQRLVQEHPTFAELSNPAPMKIGEVREVLGNNEMLLFALPMQHGTAVWAISKEDDAWYLLDATSHEISEMVQTLRCGLDVEAWYGLRGLQCAKAIGHVWKHDQPLPFRRDIAYRLFDELIGTFDDIVEGKDLTIVASGALASLPFNVLVTQKADARSTATHEDYGQSHWLGLERSISTLPSVASLRSLRRYMQASRAQKKFLGFGNPTLRGNRDCPDLPAATTCLQDGDRVARVASRSAALARSPRANVYRAGRVDSEAVNSLCPLPDTEHELKCVAKRFPPESQALFLSEQASEKMLESLNASGELANYGIVHFATHGLLAGDVAAMSHHASEPAIVFSPPNVATQSSDGAWTYDGLLTTSEISRLRLDAEWVILSACNTAGAADAGDAPLTGLAQAFFFSGARALLVSHWPVESPAAVALTTRLFGEMEQDSTIGRAEALRRAMRNLVDRNGDWSHPSIWAPFSLVGDGALSTATRH